MSQPPTTASPPHTPAQSSTASPPHTPAQSSVAVPSQTPSQSNTPLAQFVSLANADVSDVPPGPDTTKSDKHSTVTSPPSSTKVPVPAGTYPPENENANTVDPLA